MNILKSLLAILLINTLISCDGFEGPDSGESEDWFGLGTDEETTDIITEPETETDTTPIWDFGDNEEATKSVNRFDELLKSSVTITLYNSADEKYGIGSGVFISNEFIATNFHVIEYKPEKIVITRNSDDSEGIAEVYKFDMEHDVAILKINMPNPKPVNISKVLPKVGDDIIVAGSPEGLKGTISKGNVSAIRKFHPYDYDMIQISAPISHGSSGGPVVNMNGELIGISVSTLKDGQNLNFAVPVKYISHLLD